MPPEGVAGDSILREFVASIMSNNIVKIKINRKNSDFISHSVLRAVDGNTKRFLATENLQKIEFSLKNVLFPITMRTTNADIDRRVLDALKTSFFVGTLAARIIYLLSVRVNQSKQVNFQYNSWHVTCVPYKPRL